jgi:PKD repeat protein
LLFFIALFTPATAYTTDITVTKLAADCLTVIDKQTVSYQWMRDNLPVLGDGTTHYYLQGPVFVDDLTNETHEQELRWNPDEDTNCYPDKDFGALRGTNITALCNLVGGMSPGEEVKVQSSDGWYRKFAYANVYTPPAKTGPMVIAWEKNGQYPSDAGYFDGMRLVWFADTSTNPWGEHVFGNYDWYESAAPQYWYYYTSGTENYPTTTGLSGQVVSDLIIYSKSSVPQPVADFTANARTGHLINSDFETGVFPPWTNSSGSTIHTGSATYRKGSASVKLAAPVGGSASITQSVDLTNVGIINLWRYQFGATGKYVEVLIDSTVIANYTETSTISNKYELIEITKYGFTGTHSIKVNAVNTGSSLFTTYVDDVFDFGPSTSGPAPLTVQFKDLSTGMEDSAHTSWAWDFQNDGSTDSTSQNPLNTYLTDGNYAVKLTVTNAGGTDGEIKSTYIRVGPITPAPVANFTATPRTGTAPLTVQFNDTSTNLPTTGKWAYKNATAGWTQFSTERNVTYSLPAGTYDINFTATNAGGSDDEVKTGYIVVSAAIPAPVANFTATPRSGTAPLTVQFNDTSSNSPVSWKWTYKNATTGWTQFSTIRNATFTFGAGTYDVNFTATNAGGSDDEVKTGYIVVSAAIPAPVANFTATPRTGTAPLSVQFNDTSTNTPTTWKWSYKNATVGWTQFSTIRNATFTFGTGTYDVNLTATNGGGSDDEIKTGYISASEIPFIDVDVTGSVDNWIFLAGTNDDTTSVDMTIATNLNSWSISMRDALDGGKPAGTAGKMTEWTPGGSYTPSGKSLANSLQIKSGTGSYLSVSGTSQALQTGAAHAVSYDLGLRQAITVTDPALEGNNRYHIVITVTGGAT